MAEFIDLSATSRDVIGKANRRIGGEGLLPAVVYGTGHEAQSVAVDRHAFELLLHNSNITSSLVKLTVDDQKPINVVVKSVQRDAIKSNVIHVDFWAVQMDQKITTVVPVHFLGDAPGVRGGGVMMHNLQQVRVETLPTSMPDFLEADVSALEIGDSIHVSDLVALEGVTVLDAPEEIIASVVAPKVEEVEEEAVAEAGAEPEVIGEKEAESEE
jgi:large subunit ribosomal protein L25